ncbi:4Fe-4S dicluster domain-containing protein [Oscillochloris sp. ZM17-4]|uniref:4Fe-4S dicluster domain-containing protein n=1 Tax=Oscillochloris sp. ZM17-4 TaxID=2866714 RepID=UPI001C73A700|nr:4Fe-4S dicluster domain-containing protein [Oscillochloris sp. ZM17-4]MBX0327718.1 4Fe-4S dicluster domain-containing protein [Oscillochloris sp. ZM17-4]
MALNRRSLLFDLTRAEVLAKGHVLPEPARCVQCGICSYNCPIGLDVRAYAWRGEPIFDGHCLTCGQCVARCPRGVLTFARVNLCAEPTH